MPKRKETEHKGQIITFRHIQDVQEHFSFQNGLQETNTPELVFKLLKEEVYECCEALEAEEIPEIKGELGDIFIFAATVAYVLRFDLQQAIIHTYNSSKFSQSTQSDIEISKIQRARKQSHRRVQKRLIAQESVDLLLQMDRATEAYSAGQNKRMQTAIAELALVAIDVANSRGIDLQKVITGKIERNFAKYNPAVTRELLAEGLTPLEAFAHEKAQWDRSRDKDFLK